MLVAEPHVEPHAAELHAKLQVKLQAKHQKKINEKLEDLLTLFDWVKEFNQKNVLFKKISEYLSNLVDCDRSNVYLCRNKMENGLLYKNSKLWIDKNLRLDVIQKIHD